MTEEKRQISRAMVLEVLELFPPQIRQSLVADREFVRKHGLQTEAKISFGSSELSFQRDQLFDSFRHLLAMGGDASVISDEEGASMEVRIVRTNDRYSFVLKKGEKQFALPDFSPLSPRVDVRIAALEMLHRQVKLPKRIFTYWRQILLNRPLTDDEMVQLHNDTNNTPIRCCDQIRAEIMSGASQLGTLVPKAIGYYEALVGTYSGSGTLSAYATGDVREHITSLIEMNDEEAFLLALLLASSPAITVEIAIENLSRDTLSSAYDWLVSSGDRVSQTAAIELGLAHANTHPELMPFALQLIEQILEDDTEGSSSRPRLLSSLIILVDGELSRTKLLRDMPPFVRRLAAIAQASLLERTIVGCQVDAVHFVNIAENLRGRQFYAQNMIDMRVEPRWAPDYISEERLQAELISRIAIAAHQNKDKIESMEARELLFSDQGSLQTRIQFPFIYMPGPLEGGVECKNMMPPEILETIERRLNDDELTPESFIALVNSALIFQLGEDQVALAAKALRSAKYHLRNANDPELLGSILIGLATVAAVCRSSDLAQELRILVRRIRREGRHRATPQTVLHVGLTAAAAHVEFSYWCKFVGEWITELSFEDITPQEAGAVRNTVQTLCSIVPQLWQACGQADAALCAAADRQIS